MPVILDRGFDDLAAGAHASIASRIIAAVAVALLAAALLPWPICIAWAAGEIAIEAWSWPVTRTQFLKQTPTRGSQLGYLANLILGVSGWVGMGVLLWRSGSPAGAICAVTVWFSVMGFGQVYAYQSLAGYLVAGVLPAATMLTTTLLVPNESVRGFGTIWLTLLVGVAFAASSARETMLARRRYDRATRDLNASEMSYRLLADNVSDVISLSTPEGARLYVSPSMERILGFTPEEALHTPNYGYLHPDDADAVRALMASTSLETGSQAAEYRVFRKDGGLIWAESTFSRLNDGSGRILSLSRDITHRKQLEQDLVEALARSEAAAAAKADFLANMTHELRTPLNAILGFSGILKTSKSLSDQDARHVDLIHDASATLLGVIGDVLDYSKLEAGAFELDPQPFDPSEVARSAASMVEGQARAKGLSLSVQADQAPLALVGDAPRLRQVLLNFLSNAVKFTRRGGVEVLVSQTIRDGEHRLRMEVRDSGIGIPADQAEAVFLRFTQADASVSRQFGGTGLGLAISKQIIDTMGGEIGVTSVVGEGSVFWLEVTLPPAKDLHAEPTPTTAPGDFERPIRLLVVDDNAVNRELIITLLTPFAIEIDTASDGAEAVEAFGRCAYDVILMDVQMPVMDGLTATRRIRSAGAARSLSTPILAMTANVLPDQVARCQEAGMNDHLGKPINPARLLEALDRWTHAEDVVPEALLDGVG